MDKYRKLLSNSMIFAMGNLGSKLIIFILIPLYTFYLTKTEFGITDLITSSVNLLLPLVTLSIYEAVLRFVMDKDCDSSEILSTSFIITLTGSCLSFVVCLIMALVVQNNYIIFVGIILFLNSFQSLLSQYMRGIGKVKEFAINGIMTALVLSISNVVLIVYLKKGIQGYIFSIIFSLLASNIYIILVTDFLKQIKYENISRITAKKLISYSLPLIPNAFMWWIINFSNRYFITLFQGLAITGLFALANKIPSILSVFQSLFFQAWQLSAIDEFNSKESESFYTDVFNFFSASMILVTSILILSTRYIFFLFLSPDYYEAMILVPFLIMGILFSSFSSFYGTTYIAAKQTKGVMKSSLLGAFSNILICYLLIPIYGAIGASIATAISFFLIWIYRAVDTKKFIRINIKKGEFSFYLIMLILQSSIISFNKQYYIAVISAFIMFVYMFIKNKKYFNLVIKKI